MRVATVRIAPVEMWCERARSTIEKRGQSHAYPVGLPVDIIISSLTVWRYCDGRVWSLTNESANKIREVAGIPAERDYGGLCEHMLEMD